MNTRRTALVVDDMEVMRKLIGRFLEKAGFDVLEAQDGRDGLARAKARSLALIITDANMPDLDGFDFLRALRMDATQRFVPTVLMTTDLDAATLARAREAGATACLEKPFRVDALMKIVRRCCGD